MTQQVTTENINQITASDLLDLFILSRQAMGLTTASITFYRDKNKDFLKFSQLESLSNLSPMTIRLYLTSLHDRGLSSYSCHAHARALRAFLNFCVDEGYLDISPMNKVAMPKLRKKKPVTLNEQDIKTILNACTCLRDKLIVMVSLDTGLRAKELTALKFGDIQDNKILIKISKGEKERHVFIGNKTKLYLTKYYLERGKPLPDEYIFKGQRCERLTVSGLMQFYQKLKDKAGLTNLTSHTIRRTALTMMLKSGMSIYHLKEIAGHEDLRTLQHYINVEDDLQNAHSKFGVIDRL